MAARERAKVTSLEKDLLAARSEADALRKSAQVGNMRKEEALRRERAPGAPGRCGRPRIRKLSRSKPVKRSKEPNG